MGTKELPPSALTDYLQLVLGLVNAPPEILITCPAVTKEVVAQKRKKRRESDNVDDQTILGFLLVSFFNQGRLFGVREVADMMTQAIEKNKNLSDQRKTL